MFKNLFCFLVIFLISLQCSLPDLDDNTEPVVALIFPFQNALVNDNFTVTIEASDDDKLNDVWIYFDGVLLATFTEKPYEIDVDITGKRDGLSHSIQAFADDKSGNIGFSPNTTFTIVGNVDDTPVGEIIYPQTGSILSGIIEISVEAYDNVNVDFIEFFIDGIVVYTDTDISDGWSYEWDTRPYADGEDHYVYVKVYDNIGNTVFTNVVRVKVSLLQDEEEPRVTIVYPLNNTVLEKGTTNIVADIIDNGIVKSADFYIDGQLLFHDEAEPWLFSWDNSLYADDDRHTLLIKATDSSGNIGTSGIVTLTIGGDPVGDITPPVVTILYPVEGLQLNGIVTINANVIEENTITHVEFYIDGNLLGIDTDYPYSINWDTSSFEDNQTHTVFIKAYDDSGNVGLSNIINVTVVTL